MSKIPIGVDTLDISGAAAPDGESLKRARLSNDQRIQILTLCEFAGWTYQQIIDGFQSRGIDISMMQVRNTCRIGQSTPESQRKGKPQVDQLSDEQVDAITAYISESREDRCKTFAHLAQKAFAHYNVSAKVIRSALAKHGYSITEASPKAKASNVVSTYLLFASLVWVVLN
jgi:hypothetical protein